MQFLLVSERRAPPALTTTQVNFDPKVTNHTPATCLYGGCASTRCSLQASCVERKCVCNRGFIGDGQVCKPMINTVTRTPTAAPRPGPGHTRAPVANVSAMPTTTSPSAHRGAAGTASPTSTTAAPSPKPRPTTRPTANAQPHTGLNKLGGSIPELGASAFSSLKGNSCTRVCTTWDTVLLCVVQ